MGRRRKYTKEFKRDAVNYVLSHPEMTITDIAIKLITIIMTKIKIS